MMSAATMQRALLFVCLAMVLSESAGSLMTRTQTSAPTVSECPAVRRSPMVLQDGGLRLGGHNPGQALRSFGGHVACMAKAAQAQVLDYTRYPKLFAAGGLCASLTHWVTVPIDVVKTRMQVNPGEFTGLSNGISSIYKSSGFSGIMQGATPTTIGFMLQGSLKYGIYDFIKDTLALKSQDPKKKDSGGKLPVSQMIAAGAVAEMFGTTALLPFEATRIKMVADPTYGKGMVEVMKKMIKSRGWTGIYGGLFPIMCKQIPFTITQFLVFEFMASAAYKELSKRDIKTATLGTPITLASGIVAGVTASLVSQPGDTVLSVLTKNPKLGAIGAIQQLGPLGLFRGGAARTVHVSSYVVAQFLIYDSIKRLCGIPVAGSQMVVKNKKPAEAKKK